MKTAAVFDFETKSSFSIRIRSSDQGALTFEKVLTIDVTNVNEIPTGIALSAYTIAENQAVGTTVGMFSTTDPDAANTFTYSLVPGVGSTDNASFTLDSSGTLNTAAIFNFETKSSFVIRVGTTDQDGLTFEKQFTITVTNVNEAPTDITLSASTIGRNQAIGTVVGALTSIDPDAGNTFTYTLVPGEGSTDNAGFTIDGSGNLRTAAIFNGQNQTSFAIRVRTTDQGGLFSEKQFTTNVSVVNDAPTLTTVATLTGAAEDTAFTVTYATLAAAADEGDVNGDQVSFRIESVNGGSLTKGGAAVTAGITLLGPGESIVWTPANNANGVLGAFTVKAFDGLIASSTAVLVNVSVAAVNDAPTLTSISTLAGGIENKPHTMTYVDLIGAGDEADIDSATISFRIESVTAGTLTKGGVAVVAGTTLIGVGEEVVWTPSLNENGIVAAFTVKAFDGDLASSTAIAVNVNVAPVNDAPTLTTVTALTGATEDTAFTITFAALAAAANEADVDSTVFFQIGAVTNGTLTKNGVAVVPGTTTLTTGESLVWTPGLNSNGIVAAFSVKAFDGTLASATSIPVNVDVAPVNDAPTLTTVNPLADAVQNKKFTITYASLAAAADEADGDSTPILFRIQSVTSGTFTKNGVAVVPGTTTLGPGETLVWFPPTDGTGVLNACTVVCSDGALASAQAVTVSADVAVRYTHLVNAQNKKYVYIDGQGQKITVTFGGKNGTIKVIRAVPDGAQGDALDIVADGTDAKTKLTIAPPKKKTTNVTDITINGALAAFNAPAARVLGEVIASGDVATLKLGDLSSDPTLTLNGTSKLSTIKLGKATGLVFNSSGAIKSLTVVSWAGGSLTAPSITTLKTVGLKAPADAGNLSANINLTGNDPLKKNITSLTVKGAFIDSTLVSAGSIGSITVGTLNNTNIYIGSSNLGGLATSADQFTFKPTTTLSLGSLTIKSIVGSFVDAVVNAWNIGKLDLKTVTTGNLGVPLGVAGDKIASVKFIAASVNSGKVVTLTKLDTAADLTNPVKNPKNVVFPVGDFTLTPL